MNELIFTFASFLAAIITGLFYNRLLKRERPLRSNIVHNLPAQTSQTFIGRKAEISSLLDFLKPSNPKTVAGVFGMGGIGKTSLLIKVGQECVNTKMFDVVLYIPARRLSVLNNENANNNVLEAIISTTAYALEFPTSNITDSEKEAFFRASLSKRRVLLLVDGLDEVMEREQNELLHFLSSLPSQTKVIISSRRQINLPFSIQLSIFTFDEFRSLLENELSSINKAELSKDVVEKLYHLTGGLPLAVRMIAALLKDYSIETVFSKFNQENNSLYEFVVEPIISKYWNKYPYNKILITAANLSEPATLLEIAQKAGLMDEIQAVEEGLVGLTQVSLLTKDNDKYFMHPLIKEYILNREKLKQ